MELLKNKTDETNSLIMRSLHYCLPVSSGGSLLDNNTDECIETYSDETTGGGTTPTTTTTPAAVATTNSSIELVALESRRTSSTTNSPALEPRRDSCMTATTTMATTINSNINSPVQETTSTNVAPTATFTNASSPSSSSSTSSSSTSLENHHHHHHQNQNEQTQTTAQSTNRPYQKRMDRQRRNMTDPTQHHHNHHHHHHPAAHHVTGIGEGSSGLPGTHQLADDKSGIIKRNSLNDAANRRREVDEAGGVGGGVGEASLGVIRPANRGDSTSTILSTDSGVSCFDLESISIAAPSLPPHPRLVKGSFTKNLNF